MAKTTASFDRDPLAKPDDRPAPTLLKSWGKRMAKGNAMIIPVFVGGSWTLQIPRGNKRALRLTVAGKK